jgi:hypothetical protein
MAATRLSQLQKRVLRWWATDAQHTQGVVASSRQALVCALQGGKGHSRPGGRTLDTRGWRVMGRWAGGNAEALRLTPEGQKWACQCAGSYD